jgi:uncharacterized protein (DUF39 family)
MSKTIKEINEKIASGKAVVVTADEIIGLREEMGAKKAAEVVDVVTTATFGPMCSTGAFLNVGHATPPIRIEKMYLNDVESYAGLAAVDTYIGATQASTTLGDEYGGAHVICDLIDGKEVTLRAYGKGTDCYPRKEITASISLSTINEAYLYNPRNAYQSYNAAANTSSKRLFTYMGILQPNLSNITYCTSGQLSPLLNDPTYRAIGIGTRIFLAGTQGYVSWMGTQFNSSAPRDEMGRVLSPGGTLAVIGDMKKMSTDFIAPAVFERYGVSIFVGIGIPIPILDEDMLNMVCIKDSDIKMNIIDYSVSDGPKPILKTATYEELKSGYIMIDDKKIRTSPITGYNKAVEIAHLLKEQITSKQFFLTEKLESFPADNKLHSLKSI